MLTVRAYVAVAIEQLHESVHRFRLRHSRTYRVNWVHVMRDFRAECRANDAVARELTYGRSQDEAITRALAQFTYSAMYRDSH
jgi:hypothetical protein